VSAPLPQGLVPGGIAAPSAPAGGRPPQASGVAATPTKPKTVRAQMDDDLPPPPPPFRAVDAKPAPLAMPSPEQLGVGGVRKNENAVDWDVVHRRFREAGATCIQLDNRPQGGCRLVCLLPTTNPDRTHRIEAEAATEGEVARLAISQLEEWTGKK
jgi:hypothetical protein